MATVPETENIAARAENFGKPPPSPPPPPRTLYFSHPFRLPFYLVAILLIAAQSALSPAPAPPAVSAGSPAPAPQAVPAGEHLLKGNEKDEKNADTSKKLQILRTKLLAQKAAKKKAAESKLDSKVTCTLLPYELRLIISTRLQICMVDASVNISS